MISKQKVEHIAKLARLGLTPGEIKKMQGEISSILDFMEKLKKVDVSGIEPTFHSVKIENVYRKDEYQKSKVRKQKFLEMAPETKEGYLKVKSILKPKAQNPKQKSTTKNQKPSGNEN